MKKLARSLTQTQITFLQYAISALGILSFFSYDLTNLLVDQNEAQKWWEVRMIIINSGYCLLVIVPKLFKGNAKLNVFLNIGLFIFLSDLIGRITGDTDRGISDLFWTLIIIVFCLYEYRKRNAYIQ